MPRHRSFTATLVNTQREAARSRAAQERARARGAREAQRARAAAQRAQVADERERRRLYTESRVAEVEELNADLTASVRGLERLLTGTLGVDDYLDFARLKEPLVLPAWQYGTLARPYPAPDPEGFVPPSLTGLEALR